MNILLVTMSMDIGGAETHILELAKELKRRNNNVFVMSNGGKYVEELEKSGIEHINAPLHNKNILNMISSYKIIKNTIISKKIDVVHSHTRISSFICGILHKNMEFPFVTSAHGTFKVNALLKKMTDWGEYTIAVSEDIKDYLISNYNFPEENIIVTVNGIDTDRFSKDVACDDILSEFKLEPEGKRIVHVSRIDETSSLVARQLIEIAESLNEQVENLEIIIVGDGDCFEELKQKSEQINQKLGRRLIIMTGARTDINKFISAGDIFVGVSRAVLEAMSSEKAVVIAGNAGYLGIFDETKLEKGIETNFCCRGLEMSNTSLLEKDVLKLLLSEEKEKFGKYNREVVQKYYSVKKMTDDCEIIYKKVMKK